MDGYPGSHRLPTNVHPLDQRPNPPLRSVSTQGEINHSGSHGGDRPINSLRHDHSDGDISDLYRGGAPSRTEHEDYVPETWQDFVRNSTGPSNTVVDRDMDPMPIGRRGIPGQRGAMQANFRDQEARRAIMADRKRRLTAPENPARRPEFSPPGGSSVSQYGHPSASNPPPYGMSGSSASNVIDLTTPESSFSRRSAGLEPNRTDDITLPPWQPDSEVSQCPVCGVQFGLWNRRHHCRKCGRVVCAKCSPHRITIPRQFIVHPPAPSGLSATNAIDLTSDSDDTDTQSHYYNPALGGGEEVRVCNPCVPDPNFSPPSLQATLTSPFSNFPSFDPNSNWDFQQGAVMHASESSHFPAFGNNFPVDRPELSGMQLQQPGSPSYYHAGSSSNSVNSTQRMRPASFHVGMQMPDNWTPSVPPIASGVSRFFEQHGGSHPNMQYSARGSSLPRHRHTASASAVTTQRHPSVLNMNAPLPPIPPAVPPRQIAEEDCCPICLRELPPKGSHGDTTDREQHIEECIASYSFSSSAPANSAPTRQRSGTGTRSEVGSEPSSSRMRRTTGTRMLAFRASEKDCVGEDGEAQECIICFEEFEEGDDMGRLDCLCKFHRSCIRKWWDTKGVGSCPTHQLHD